MHSFLDDSLALTGLGSGMRVCSVRQWASGSAGGNHDSAEGANQIGKNAVDRMEARMARQRQIIISASVCFFETRKRIN